jgi:Tol biopolymer transport system component
MGEVYRARDMTLGRDVAIKMLPATFSVDPERLARFEREAQLLASLNHPNICAIHGIADIDGTPGLVLELVEGATLAERIVRRLSVSEALTIARDIARALEAAHDKEIVHRDLKPTNIKLTLDGIVKVLDFGLAKAANGGPTLPLTGEPDIAAGESRDGVLLGTAAYMSPEQARGQPLDKRTDIWSFGCVLYEMLTSRRAANGATVSETIAAVLDCEPEWTALPAATPPSIQRLLKRCLEKDIRQRLKDIGDARLEIEDVMIGPGHAVSGGSTKFSPVVWPWLVTTAIVLLSLWFIVWSRSTPRVPLRELRRVSAEFGTDASIVTFQFGQGSAIVLSPDSSTLAFVGRPNEAAPTQLYVRPLDQLRAAPLAGTDGALNPFFSPDGQWIAFFAQSMLKKAPTRGGGVVTVCEVRNNRDGAWGEDGMITFSPGRESAPLWHVSAAGGRPEPLTALAEGETTQRWPQMLRGGRAVLFTGNSRPDGFEHANVVVQVLPNGPRKLLVPGAYYGRYLPSGHLIYMHGPTLFAAAFDLDRLEITGQAVPVLEDATVDMPVGAAEIALSDTGAIAYLPAPAWVKHLEVPIDWMDRDGKSTPLRTMAVRWLSPRFAPDGRRLAFSIFDGTQQDVWTYDWSCDELTRLTFDSAGDVNPVWTPDGRRIAFGSTRPTRLIPNLYWQRVDGSGEVQRLTESDRAQTAGSWHPRGKTLAFTEIDTQSAVPTIMVLRLEGDEATGWRPTVPMAFLKGAEDPIFSPDGRWLAYVSKEAGRNRADVYVRPFPGPGGPWQISTEGGDNPTWSRTRQELFYGAPDHRIMTASYSVAGDSFLPHKPHALPNSRFSPLVVWRSFDVHPDGNRFALVKAPEVESGPKRDHVTLIFNFFDELHRIAPTGQ